MPVTANILSIPTTHHYNLQTEMLDLMQQERLSVELWLSAWSHILSSMPAYN